MYMQGYLFVSVYVYRVRVYVSCVSLTEMINFLTKRNIEFLKSKHLIFISSSDNM